MRLHIKSLVMDPEVEVIDNFLLPDEFKKIQSHLLDEDFTWNWNNGILDEDYPLGSYQFTHAFFMNGELSDSHILKPCMYKLGCKTLVRVKSNLNLRTVFHRNGGYHCDNNTFGFDMKVALLYINTNNGCTKIKGYGKVKCVANRLVRFNSYVEHAGISCTDEKRKVVLNFNYHE